MFLLQLFGPCSWKSKASERVLALVNKFQNRIKVNYEHGIFDGGAPNNKNLEQENALVTRLRVGW